MIEKATGKVKRVNHGAVTEVLYRQKVEFAVGHGIAVHAEPVAADPYRAVSVRTSVIPRSEVAKVEAPGPDDPALDESYFPLLWSKDDKRTAWIDSYCETGRRRYPPHNAVSHACHSGAARQG